VNWINLEIERAVSCGLIVNEILANSSKPAFPGRGKGGVSTSLHKFRKNNEPDSGVRLSTPVHLPILFKYRIMSQHILRSRIARIRQGRRAVEFLIA
jgi:two-component sensor histidine kinase